MRKRTRELADKMRERAGRDPEPESDPDPDVAELESIANRIENCERRGGRWQVSADRLKGEFEELTGTDYDSFDGEIEELSAGTPGGEVEELVPPTLPVP